MKYFGIALVLAAFSFATGCNSTPSADAVCDNVVSIMEAELGEAMGDAFNAEEMHTECVAEFGNAEEECGDNAGEAMRCMANAESLEDMEACEGICEGGGGDEGGEEGEGGE